MRAAIYARVSTDGQADNYSTDSQIESCRKYAAEKGYEIVAEYREVHTGSELSRPELNSLRTLAQNSEIDAVLTFKLDRLARDFVIPFIVERELQAYGVEVKYVNARYDESESGDVQKMLDAIVAHIEHKNIVQRLGDGKRDALKAGDVILNRGQVDMFGYRVVNKKYEINEPEAAVVRMIYDWYVNGDESGKLLGSYQIAQRLNEMSVPTSSQRNPGIKLSNRRNPTNTDRPGWQRTIISRMLANEAYTGVIYWGRTRLVKDPLTGKGKPVPVPKEEWIKCDIPAIIDRETWEKSCARAAKNKKDAVRNTKFVYLVRRRIRCAQCGYSCYALTPKNRYSYYKCKGVDRNNYADGKARCAGVIRADLVDAAVWDVVADALKNPEKVVRTLREKQAEFEPKQTQLKLSRDSVASLLAEAQEKKDRLIDAYASGMFTKEDVGHRVNMLNEQIASFKEQVERYEEELNSEGIPEHVIDSLLAVSAQIRDDIDHLSLDEKRNVIELCNVNVMAHPTPGHENDVFVITGYFPATAIRLNGFTGKADKLWNLPEQSGEGQ